MSPAGNPSSSEPPADVTATYVASTPAGAAAEVTFLAPPQQPGELGRMGRYRVLRQVGAGGMGVVYEAEDPVLQRRVALKVMQSKVAQRPTARARFIREARSHAQVRHENVVTVFDVGEDRGIPYLALEFLEGTTLERWLARNPRPSPRQILRIGREIAAGLEAAHARGLVHRDIKPGNIWLEMPRGRVKILDFGLARAVDDDSRLTVAGTAVGSPAYMSPEQARGEPVDHRTDLFSFGAVLYQLCVGRPPFWGEGVMAVLGAVLTQTPVPIRERNPEIPPALAELVHSLLAKDAAHRPTSAAEVGHQLRTIGQNLTGASAIVPSLGAMLGSGTHPTELNAATAETAPRPILSVPSTRPLAAWKQSTPTAWRQPILIGTALLTLAVVGTLVLILGR